MIASLDPLIAEMDLNPVIAGPGGAIAVDALVMRVVIRQRPRSALARSSMLSISRSPSRHAAGFAV